MAEERTIAVLGAGGIMGRPMAANLAAAGFTVRAWNRTREKAEQDGVEAFDSPGAAAEGADTVLTMLSDAQAVLDAAGEALGDDDLLWLQMSTIGIEGTERAKALASERGATFVDAPVLGTKGPAEAGELVVIGSGPDDVHGRAEPVFDAVGSRTVWVGDSGAGTRVKLVANAWVVSVMEGIAETLAFGEGIGVEPETFLDVVDGGAMDLPYLHVKGKAIIERSFEPSFKLALAAKDAALVMEAAQEAGLDLPLLRTVRDRMLEGAEEHGDEDMAATYLTSAPGR
jgi:3-hydroxyisobutyrate dehydrogenase